MVVCPRWLMRGDLTIAQTSIHSVSCSLFGLGARLTQLDLASTATLQEALKAIGDYARANPQQAWVIGRGWNQEIWKLGRFPTAADIRNTGVLATWVAGKEVFQKK
jgi:predicted amidohydrolase YtcJ